MKAGYLLPDSIPDDDCVWLVWVPNEPAFERAFVGSLVGLSQWVNWQRDDSNGAALAAQRMKQANAETFRIQTGAHCMSAKVLIETLQLIASRVGAGECCCDGEMGDGLQEEVPQDGATFPDEGAGDPPPPDMAPDGEWTTFHQNLCDNAHALVDGLVAQVPTMRLVLRYTSAGLGVSAFMLGLVSPWLKAIIPSAQTLLGILAALAGVSESGLDDLETEVELFREDFVCAVVESATPADAQTAFYAVVDTLERSDAVKAAIKAVVWPDLFNTAYTSKYRGRVVQVAQSGRDCSFCGQPTGDGAFLNPLLQGGLHSSENGGVPFVPDWHLWPDEATALAATNVPNWTDDNPGLGISGDGAIYVRGAEDATVGWYQDVHFDSTGDFAVTINYRQTGSNARATLRMERDGVPIRTLAATSGATSGFENASDTFPIENVGTYRFIFTAQGFGSAYAILEGLTGTFTPDP